MPRFVSRIEDTSSIEDHARLIQEQVEASLRDPQTRKLATSIVSGTYDWVRDPRTGVTVPAVKYHGRYYRAWYDSHPPGPCAPRDDVCALTAIWNFMVMNVRYTPDVDGYDTYPDLRTMLESGGEDCFPEGTLLLDDRYSFVPVEQLHPGMKIWGLNRWSEVQAVWPKGELAVDLIHLNNGSTLQLSPDHHVYVLHCHRHRLDRKGQPCWCPVEEREEIRIRVSELQQGMVLPQPANIPFGREEMDPARAYIEGLYLSDGWASEPYRFFIAGLDGCPKEEQKRDVESICNRLGISTRLHRKYIAVNDPDWAKRMLSMGHKAPNKHALGIGLQEPAAGELLRGILADSGSRGGRGSDGLTFTTTSRELMLQTRVLMRMFGVSAGYKYIEKHGGLGKNPIYRLSTRERRDGKATKLLRVKAIDRAAFSAPCWDITTDDHRVYLPEHDVTVSQCDGFTVGFCALGRAAGYPCVARIISQDGKEWAHVYPLVQIDRGWIPVDATEDGKTLGWEYPRPAAIVDFDMGSAA